MTEESKQLAEVFQSKPLDQCNSNAPLTHENYKLVDLCQVYLNDRVQPSITDKPGALHKVHWMTKLIYSSKNSLLEP